MHAFPPSDSTPQPLVLHEDPWLLAVDKPAGLLVHPSWIAPARTPNLVAWLKQRYPGESLHPVHRLDRATSGVMLFARDRETAQALQRQFSERQVEKTYLCVARGWTPEHELIDYPLKPIHDRIADKHSAQDKPAQDAITAYRRLATVELPIPVGRYPVARYSLLEVRPHTGRKHQIRRHMKHIFHPLVGDTKHGEGRHNRLFREHFACHRLLLMATRLQFDHPHQGERWTLEAAVSPEVDRLFRQLGWSGLYPAPTPTD